MPRTTKKPASDMKPGDVLLLDDDDLVVLVRPSTAEDAQHGVVRLPIGWFMRRYPDAIRAFDAHPNRVRRLSPALALFVHGVESMQLPGTSRQAFGTMAARLLNWIVRSCARFDEGDFALLERMSSRFRSGSGQHVHVDEALYALAVESGNASAWRAYEAHVGRPPFFWSENPGGTKKRLAVGSRPFIDAAVTTEAGVGGPGLFRVTSFGADGGGSDGADPVIRLKRETGTGRSFIAFTRDQLDEMLAKRAAAAAADAAAPDPVDAGEAIP